MDAVIDAGSVFVALAERTRFAITELLAARGPMSAGTISAEFAASAPAISQHLKVLREAAVVHVERRGQSRVYRINEKAIGDVESWASTIRKKLQSRYDHLEQLLNEED